MHPANESQWTITYWKDNHRKTETSWFQSEDDVKRVLKLLAHKDQGLSKELLEDCKDAPDTPCDDVELKPIDAGHATSFCAKLFGVEVRFTADCHQPKG